jgi:hypothetical protein
MKTVPNWISYFHEFSWIFSQLLAILLSYFHSELFLIQELSATGSHLSASISPCRAHSSAHRLCVAPRAVAMRPRARALKASVPTEMVRTLPPPLAASRAAPTTRVRSRLRRCHCPSLSRLTAVPTGWSEAVARLRSETADRLHGPKPPLTPVQTPLSPCC